MKFALIALAALLLAAFFQAPADARGHCQACQGGSCRAAEFPTGSPLATIPPVSAKAWPWTPPSPKPTPAPPKPAPVVTPVPVAPVAEPAVCCGKTAHPLATFVTRAPRSAIRLTAAIIRHRPHLLGRVFCRR